MDFYDPIGDVDRSPLARLWSWDFRSTLWPPLCIGGPIGMRRQAATQLRSLEIGIHFGNSAKTNFRLNLWPAD
jgi:hypothetical protein